MYMYMYTLYMLYISPNTQMMKTTILQDSQQLQLQSPVTVKLSGDGAPFHRSTYVLMSFSLPMIDKKYLLAKGITHVQVHARYAHSSFLETHFCHDLKM